MVQWQSNLDLLIPGRRPAELRNLAKTGPGWLSRGFHVRISDDRITARYNEFSHTSVAPTMKGRLVQDEHGTRVLGRIRWTVLVLGPIFLAGGAVGFAFLSLDGIARDGPVSGIFTGLAALSFSWLAILGFRMQDAVRKDEESRLRQGLLSTFARRGR